MKKIVDFLAELNHATVGVRKMLLSIAGLLTLMRLASMHADPAYAWVVGCITVPALAALLGERFSKVDPYGGRSGSSRSENHE